MITETWKKVFKWFGLVMAEPKKEEKGHWWDTMMLYLSYCVAWKYRLNEIRVGHSKFQVAKGEDGPKDALLSDFGITSKYHIFAEGITIPPEV